MPPLLTAGTLAIRLTEERDYLLALINGMESEFLATGEGLGRLAQQLYANQKECQSLTDMTLGQGQDAPIQFAFQLLKKSEDLVLTCYDQYDHVFVTFNEMQRRLAHLSSQRDALMRVLLPLNFITLSFRIEASRHPVNVQQAFSTLADHVNLTVNEVRSTLDRQFADLTSSEHIARTLMDQVSSSIQKSRCDVTTTLNTARDNLCALCADLTRSGSGAMNLVHLIKEVHRHLGDIVMAQQCQDITRQRIEHVGEAMHEMHTHLADQPSATSASEAECGQFIVRAGQIQLHQVQHVFDQLNRAAECIKTGIKGLRAEAGSAAAVAVRVGGTRIDADIARQCQAGIGEILGIARQAVQKITGIIAAFDPLQASFVDCTSKASALASDVRRAGLNAQVFAIHAPNGATLEVLAGRMRTISEEVIDQVEKMGFSLNHTTEMVNNLRQRLEDFQILGHADLNLLADESARSQMKLLDLKEAIPLLIQRVTEQQSLFGQSVESVLSMVRFPDTIAEASARSVGFFQYLVNWGGEGASGGVADVASEKIDLLKARYTMDSERHAHAAASDTEVAKASDAASESFIELFDGVVLSPAPFTDSATARPLKNERSEDRSPLPGGSMRTTIPLDQDRVLASSLSSANDALGDNVDLF